MYIKINEKRKVMVSLSPIGKNHRNSLQKKKDNQAMIPRKATHYNN